MSAAVEQPIRARPVGLATDIVSIAGRALRSILRDPEGVFPPLVVGTFFYIINIGALQDLAETLPDVDYRAFQLPVAITFAITGVSRAITVVTDITSGYFDKLSITPVNRLALLLGFMAADLALVVALSIPVLVLGFIFGVRFETGALGVLTFIAFAGIWGLSFTGFMYAIALKTGNPAAVNSSFLLFFPFMFLTTTFLPKEALTDWLGTIAVYNPVTYLLDALRSLISRGWEGDTLLKGLAGIAAVGSVSMTLALLALRSRVRRR
jgi:ABC-2 type transport system permease protein